MADFEYFSTSGYYVSLVLYDIWPVENGTVVHRVDLLSAPSLAFTKGIERIAYGKIMLKELKKAIQAFQEDMRKNGKLKMEN